MNYLSGQGWQLKIFALPEKPYVENGRRVP